MKKESEIFRLEQEKRNAAFDALVETRKLDRVKKEMETKLFQDKQKDDTMKKVHEEKMIK